VHGNVNVIEKIGSPSAGISHKNSRMKLDLIYKVALAECFSTIRHVLSRIEGEPVAEEFLRFRSLVHAKNQCRPT